MRYEALKNSLVTTSLIRRAAFDFIGGWPESAIFRTHAHAGEDVAFEELFRVCFDTAWLAQKLYNYTHRPGNTFDRFLARTVVEGGKLNATEASSELDTELFREIGRLKRLLRDRIRKRILEPAAGPGLPRLDAAP